MRASLDSKGTSRVIKSGGEGETGKDVGVYTQRQEGEREERRERRGGGVRKINGWNE